MMSNLLHVYAAQCHIFAEQYGGLQFQATPDDRTNVVINSTDMVFSHLPYNNFLIRFSLLRIPSTIMHLSSNRLLNEENLPVLPFQLLAEFPFPFNFLSILSLFLSSLPNGLLTLPFPCISVFFF